MKIESVQVKNFLSHADTTVAFGDKPLWLVVGPNGAGKSALFDAIEFALYGRHRGGEKQYFQYLVRSNSEDAEITVIFSHAGHRYRATRKLNRRKGNVGGSLFVEQNDEWRPVGMAEGRRAVWDYVEANLVPYDIFVSAIYLKQGAVDFFMSDGSGERGRRFARLLNLEEYDNLAEAAKARAEEENHTADVRARDLATLGDTELAIRQLKERLDEVSEEERTLTTQLEDLARREAGAREWAEKTAAIEEIDAEVSALQELLDQADTIRTAADQVQGWDAIAGDIQRFWSRFDQAETARHRALETRSAAEEQERIAKDEEVQEQDAAAQLELWNRRLEEAESASQRARESLSEAKLEHDIAVQVAGLQAVRARQERLSGSEEAYANWQMQQRALPRLRSVVDSRRRLENLQEQLAAASAQRKAREKEKATRERESTLAAAALDDAKTALFHIESSRRTLENDIRVLEEQIDEHSRLGVGESRCPVCDQSLDGAAHAHVQKVIRDKQADLMRKRQSLQEMSEESTRLGRERDAAEERVEESRQLVQQAQQRMQETIAKIQSLEARIADAEDSYEQAIESVRAEAPAYAEQATSLTREDVGAIEAALADEKERVATDYQLLQTAHQEERELLAQIKALRSRRPAGLAEGPGDTEELVVLEERVFCLERDVRDKKNEIQEIGRTKSEYVQKERQHTKNAAGARASARSLSQQAERSEAEADKAKQEYTSVRVPANWQRCLTDRDEYQSRRQDMERLRPIAARVGELREAEGTLKSQRKRRKRLEAERQTIPEEYRVDIGKVREELAVGEAGRQKLSREHTALLGDLRVLEERDRQSKSLQVQVAKSRLRASGFSELGRLLGEGGAIQLRVAATVQEEVRHAANDILAQINDGLEIRLGEPLRAGKAVLDVLVFDRRDPASGERYYEFLSGGEQFRVGLAIALAIHFRAVGRSPGTVIVDEGFGALDNLHRRALCEQIANVSEGLLTANLVEQIIVCTHAEDVQAYFPCRLEIEKQDGVAVLKTVESGVEVVSAQ